MANNEITAIVQKPRDTSANWESLNPVLPNGVTIIVDTNAGEVRSKTGDGTKKYTELPFDDEAIKALITDTKKALSTRVDTNEQALTEVQKLQARSNIGAMSADYIAPVTSVNEKSGAVELTASDVYAMPQVTVNSVDNGKFLRVVNGRWAAERVINAEEVGY